MGSSSPSHTSSLSLYYILCVQCTEVALRLEYTFVVVRRRRRRLAACGSFSAPASSLGNCARALARAGGGIRRRRERESCYCYLPLITSLRFLCSIVRVYKVEREVSKAATCMPDWFSCFFLQEIFRLVSSRWAKWKKGSLHHICRWPYGMGKWNIYGPLSIFLELNSKNQSHSTRVRPPVRLKLRQASRIPPNVRNVSL